MKSDSSSEKYIGLLAMLMIVVGVIVLSTNSVPPTLHVGNHTYRLEVATTTAAQEKGLGDRASLPTNQGMLFSFSNEAVRCFWMKDTHFPLDMIWLNSNKQVLHIESNVSPSTYPETFCPNEPAQYVIELNAGQARAAGITTGQSLKF
jgi:uncharacterized membrane protein (UPF0127 family)